MTPSSYFLNTGGYRREAVKYFRRALDIRKAQLESNDTVLAKTLYELGRCVREAGRPREAENYVRYGVESCGEGLSSGFTV